MFDVLFFSIAKTTDGEAVVLVDAEPAHAGVVVFEVAVVGEVATVLGSTPKVGADAETAVVAAVAASGKGRKTCGIVAGGCVVAHCASISTAAPAPSGGQRLGYVSVVAAAHILALAAYIVGELRPLRIAWHVPPRWTDTLYAARNGTG